MTTNYLHFSNPLERARLAGDGDLLVAELENVKSHRSLRKDRARMLKQILHEAESSKVRNAAAIAAADMRIEEAGSWIIDTLERPELALSPGTLLYALSELKVLVPLKLLINILENGSYEAKAEAIMIIENGNVLKFGDAVRTESIRRLRALASSGDEDTSEAALIGLEYLKIASWPSHVGSD